VIQKVDVDFLDLRDAILVRHQGDNIVYDHVLALADELTFRFDDRLQEMEIFHVSAVCLNAVNEMLDHFIAQFAAQLGIVLKNGTNRLSFQQLKS
jgi:hypothetical protein